MHTKLISWAVLPLFLVSFLPLTASAQSVSNIQAQISALMEQIKALQSQLQTLQTSSGVSGMMMSSEPTSAGHCQRIETDLKVGNSGNDTSNLQRVLMSKGYLSLPMSTAPGYFGSLTQRALMRWQSDNGISSTGYFGPLSRSRFNILATSCGEVSNETPLPIPSTSSNIPNSGGNLVVSPSSLTLAVGGQSGVEALFTPEIATCTNCGAAIPRPVTASWTSGNSNVATVKVTQIQCFMAPCNPLVSIEGKSAGSATITASYTDTSGRVYSASLQVSVGSGASGLTQ